MGSERQQGEVVSEGGNGRPGVACCFQGPELRAGSQANMAQGSVAADDGLIGGSLGHVLGGERRQGEAVQGSGSGGAEAACRFLGSELRVDLGLVGVDRRSGHNDCAARRVQARRRMEARRPGRSRWLGGLGTRVLAQLRRRRPSAPGCEQRRRRCSRQAGGGRRSANGGERRLRIGDGRLDGGRARRRSRLLGCRGWLRRTRAAGRGQLRQVPVRPVLGKGGVCGFCKERQRLAC